jgi:hypothetical protein
MIFHIVAQDIEIVDLGRQIGRDRGMGRLRGGGKVFRRACGVGMDLRFEPQRPDCLAALRQRLMMTADDL